jgi:HK97 family phage major capsid protein
MRRHPVTVTRGDGRPACISVDVTPRKPAPKPVKPARTATCGQCAGAGHLHMARSAPPRRSLAELRQRAHQIIDADLRDDPENLMRAEYAQVRDAALRCIETKGANLSPTAQDRLEELVRTRTADCDGKAIARHVVVTSSDAYVRAFAKSLTDKHPAFDPAEAAAVNAYRSIAPKATREERAAGEGGSFGLAVPVMISPDVVISATLDDAPILGVARVVQTTTDNWRGIATGGGGGFTLPGEGVVVADGSPTFTQPTIQIFSPKDFIPFSIEVSQDFPGFLDQMGRLFAADYADRISQDTAIGAGGTAAPMGVFTRMAATTAGSGAAHVTVTTPGSICAADVRAVWQALPERAKNDPSCAWLMSNSVWSQITALGAPSVSNGLEPGAVQYPVGNAGPRLYGEPVLFSTYASAFTGTSGAANYLVVGAFQSYAIAQRVPGLTVELVPQMFDFAGGTGRPTGDRGFLAVARFGADVLDTASFRLLSNS